MLCVPISFVQAQVVGGQHTYQFLTLPTSARTTALGGIGLPVIDNDLSLALQNPSLYNAAMNKQLSVNNDLYFADINYGHIAFGKSIDSLTTIGLGLQYMAYGQFTATDETAQNLGTFNAGEYALYLGGARHKGKFSYGVNTKLIFSQLETYKSLGIAFDAGVTYNDTSQQLLLSLVVKNIGTQITQYADTQEELPFDVQLAVSKRLAHLPVRFGVTAHHLYQWDIRYDDPALQVVAIFDDGNTDKEERYVVDKLFRHLNFSTEIYLGKALQVRLGYSHLRRQEMMLTARRTLAGFSFGAGIHIKRFQVSYGRAIYHAAGGNNHISLGINLAKPSL